MSDIIPGFVPAIVLRNDDPEGAGRIKVCIPGKLAETPYWVMPMGYNAKKPQEGSRFPPPEPQMAVGVIFAYGEYQHQNSQAYYFTGYYGLNTDGSAAGPPSVASAPTVPQVNARACLWEDDTFRIMVHNDPGATDKKVIVQSKIGGSKIELNAADGASGKAETITLEARTAVIIYSQGLIDIDSDTQVKICGRPVSKLSEAEI